MVCALNDPSTSLPYESLERILEQSQDTPSTLYLAYKMALLHDEPELGKLSGTLVHMVSDAEKGPAPWKHYIS